MSHIRLHLERHGRFYGGVIAAVIVWYFAAALGGPARLAAGGDAFFVIYLVSAGYEVLQATAEGLRKRAQTEDEGIVLIILIAIAVICVSSFAVVTILHQKQGGTSLSVVLALAGIPLGWSTLHTIAAFRYADLYYARKENGPQSVRGLEFPGTKEPGIWDFLYYAFTIGTTAQTSDTNLTDTKMRRATLGHSIVAFFYNTAIIAMAINAVVAIAS